MDLESGLFRIFDEALTAYLGAAPDRVALTLDWTPERLDGRVSASRDRTTAIEQADRERDEVEAQMRGSIDDRGRGRGRDKGKELPPALVAMIDDRRVAAEAAAEAARTSAIVVLPAATWREIQQRAATVGITVELAGGGGELRISVELPRSGEDGSDAS
jgi:hypothetical protein